MTEIRIRRHKPAGQPRRWRAYITTNNQSEGIWIEGLDKDQVLGLAAVIASARPTWQIIDEAPKDRPVLEAGEEPGA